MGSQASSAGLTKMPDNPEIWKAAAMADQFDKMQKLPDPLPGAPNFHRIPGYKVYTTGQPTLEGIKNVLEKVTGTIYPKDGPIIWLNLRQEPDVYVNGQPICARPPNKIGEYAELGAVTRDIIKADEAEFFKVVEGRVKENGGKLKYVTITKEEKEVEVKELKTLSEAMEAAKADFPGLVHWRVPVCNSASPLETDFDIICNTLVGTSINTPVIVTDQVGLSRATTGSVIACLFKEFQINASFEGLVETVPGVNLDLLRMDKYTMDPAKDPLFRGEFPVVLALLEKLKGGKEAKNECDKVIDKNGTPKTGGNGIKQLRENIAESKLSYEIMDDSAQAFLKVKIMDNIQKYFYLITFTSYMREASQVCRDLVEEEKKKDVVLTGGKCSIPANKLKLHKTFVQWMDDHAELRPMIETGKGDLQWERDIPPEALKNLENLAKEDFKKNMGKIIHDIYQTAHVMFSDMPQGDHKKRAKYRFASKTLMRILPSPQKELIHDLIEKKEISMDLYDILGKCTWREGGEPEPEEKKEGEGEEKKEGEEGEKKEGEVEEEKE